MKYNFSDDKSLIKDVEIFNHGKTLEALIHVPNGIGNSEAKKIQEGLQSFGYDVMYGTHGDEAVLKVFGVDSANNLLGAMSKIEIGERRAVTVDYSASKSELDEQKTQKDDNWQKRAAIFTAGSLYTVGNFSTIAAGLKRGNTSEAIQGLAWAGPGLGLMMSGLQTADTQMPFLYGDFDEFLQQNDIRVPANVQNLLDDRKTDNNLWDKTWRLATGNASNAFAACEFVGAIMGVKAGRELGNNYKAIASGIMGAGMLTSLVTEEKHPKYKESIYLGNSEAGKKVPEPEAKNGGLLGLLQEHPMIAAGGLAELQNWIKIVGIFEVDKKNRMNFDGLLRDETLKGKDADILNLMRSDEYNVNDVWKTGKYAPWRQESKSPIVGEYYTERLKLEDKLKETKSLFKNSELDSAEEGRLTAQLKDYDNKLKELEDKRNGYELGDKAANLDALATGSFIVANAITIVTSKDNTPDLLKSGGVDSLVEISANIIMDYPENSQKAVAQRLATFIANHQYVKLNVDDVVSMINDKMEVLQSAAWLGNNIEFRPFDRADGASFDLVKASQNPQSKVESERASLEKLYGAEAAVSEAEELNANKTKLEKILSREESSSQMAGVGV